MKSPESEIRGIRSGRNTRELLALISSLGSLIVALVALYQVYVLVDSRVDTYASCLYEKRLEAMQALESDIMGIDFCLMGIFAQSVDGKYLKELPLSLFETRLTRPTTPQKLRLNENNATTELFIKALSKYIYDLYRYIPILGEETSDVCLAFLNGTLLNLASGMMDEAERKQFIKQFQTYAGIAKIDIDVDVSKIPEGTFEPGNAIKNQMSITRMVSKTFANLLGVEAFDFTKVLMSPTHTTFDKAIKKMVLTLD